MNSSGARQCQLRSKCTSVQHTQWYYMPVAKYLEVTFQIPKGWSKKPLFVSTDCGDDSKVELWDLKAMASEYEVELVEGAVDCGYPILTQQKMDEAIAAAMLWYESNTLKKIPKS
jgi:hypothetical protein